MLKHSQGRSIFGFKILNAWYSILWSYIFILYQVLILPFLSFDNSYVIASILFILLINFSITILIINSVIRIRKFNSLFLLLDTPLLIYLPFTINKIFFSLNYLWIIIARSNV